MKTMTTNLAQLAGAGLDVEAALRERLGEGAEP